MASDKSDLQEQTNFLVGMGAGGTAMGVAGAVVGGITGGPVGAVAGAALGGMVGSVAGGAIAYGDVEPEFRREYETSTTSARGSQRWEDVSPAYRYGWDSHERPEFQGKAWDQVSPDLEKSWTGGQWAAHEPLVRSAWERRSRVQGAARGNQAGEDPTLFGQGTGEMSSLVVGGSTGALIGGVMGMALGGPVGLLVGGTLGTAVGAWGSQEVAHGWHDEDFRTHHKDFYPQGGAYTWDQAQPAYRYGWDAHDLPAIQGKSWDEALPELQKNWPGPGTFADYQRFIHEGWVRRTQPKLEPKTPEWVK